jgi:phosphatidylinositol alpha-1,6-mannosyltransferase
VTVVFIALAIYSREGGMERFNRLVLDSLAARGGARAIVLWDPPTDARNAPPGLVFEGCGESKLRALRAFVRALRRDRPDVLLYGHALLAPLALVTRLLRHRARNVLIAHGYEVWDPPGLVKGRLVRAAIDRVASVSDFTAESMAAAYGMGRDRFVRVINAVDVGDPPPRGVRGQPPRRLLCVSRLNPLDKDKHVDDVIRAMPRILAAAGDVHLYVVGDGTWRPELAALTESLGMGDHVHLLGTVSDEERDELYATSDAFVLPSTQEGFGIVYLEAWRHRLPVIAGAGGAAPEVVRDGIEGLVVEPEPAAIAEAALRLLDDATLARDLAEAGYRRLTEHFTPRHFHEAFTKMLDRVAA